MKKVIVTGVTGQDGSLMADYLLNNVPDIMIYGGIRRLSVPNHKNINHLIHNNRFSLLELDVTDSENVKNVISEIKPDYYVNFAANSFVGNSWRMPVNHFNTNCMAVLYALESIKNFSKETKFYNAGSSEQFGDVEYYPQDIKHPFKPRSPYGASKCAAHHLVKVYRESFNLFAVQGILFNHEGKRRGEEFVTRKITKKIAQIKKSIEQGKQFSPLELGNIYSRRDWSDAEDFIEGVWKMINQEYPKDYVLASGETHTIKEFINYCLDIAGINGSWVGEGLNEQFISDKTETIIKINKEFYRPAEVDLLLGDSTLARQELNWEPKINFQELVKKMFESDYNSV